jgi:hypothetical protein
MKCFKPAIAMIAMVCGAPAHAFTECQVTPTSLFAGDGGTFYIFFSNGGSAVTTSTSNGGANFKQFVAFATTALMMGSTLKVRYSADGVACTAAAQDLAGLWLLPL